MSKTVTIGPYVVGEKPSPLEYQFLDSSGSPINIAGWTAKFQCQELFGTVFSGSATVTDGANGKAQYVFTGSEFPTSGQYRAAFIVGNGSNRFESVLIKFDVSSGVGPMPSI
jgi:hypothetical protein